MSLSILIRSFPSTLKRLWRDIRALNDMKYHRMSLPLPIQLIDLCFKVITYAHFYYYSSSLILHAAFAEILRWCRQTLLARANLSRTWSLFTHIRNREREKNIFGIVSNYTWYFFFWKCRFSFRCHRRKFRKVSAKRWYLANIMGGGGADSFHYSHNFSQLFF